MISLDLGIRQLS